MSGVGQGRQPSPVNHLFDAIESVLQKMDYDLTVSAEEERNFDAAMAEWENVRCQKHGCPHLGDTCRFLGVDLDWVKALGYADLCEFLHAKKPPKRFDILRAYWARLPGDFRPR